MTTPADILATPINDYDSGASTIAEYLTKLLEAVWEQDEGFSGKRPFGNSGWKHDVYEALVRAGHVEGVFDEDGYLDDYDYGSAESLIFSAIRELSRRKLGSVPNP